MLRLLLPLLSIVFIIGPLQSVCFARRGIPIPIIWGHGETVSQIGLLPDDVREALKRELSQDVSVGFMYGHAHVFYADLWTWNGKHVLFNGQQYWELNDDQWLQIIGETPSQRFGVPLLYRFPLGLALLSFAIVVSVLWPMLFPSDAKRFQKIANDSRYTAALESVLPSDSQWLRTDYDQQRYESAIISLTHEGISEAKARKNFDLLLTAACTGRSVHFAEWMRNATYFAENGPIADGISILEKLSEGLPTTDPRRAQVLQLLSKLRDDAAHTEAPSEESGEDAMAI